MADRLLILRLIVAVLLPLSRKVIHKQLGIFPCVFTDMSITSYGDEGGQGYTRWRLVYLT